MPYAVRPYAVMPYAVISGFEVGDMPAAAIRATLTGDVLIPTPVSDERSVEADVTDDRRAYVTLRIS